MSSSGKFGTNHLVVVPVISGRYFPNRRNVTLMVEAELDGETLVTNEEPHTDAPQFYQELAWEMTKTALHMHRLQRRSIKMHLFAIRKPTSTTVDKPAPIKEEIGYFLLDVRAATERQVLNWYPILHCSYKQARKPEIKAGIYVEEIPARSVERADPTEELAKPRPSDSPRGRQRQQGLQEGLQESLHSPPVHDDQVVANGTRLNGSSLVVDLPPSRSPSPRDNARADLKTIEKTAAPTSPPTKPKEKMLAALSPQTSYVEGLHHFNVLIHLRSIFINRTSMKTRPRLHVHYRYDYFGTEQTISSGVFECTPATSMALPNAVTSFEFVSSWNALTSAFQCMPLELNVSRRQLNGTEEPFAKAAIPLGTLLSNDGADFQCWRVERDFELIAPKTTSDLRRGTINVSVVLRDCGPVDAGRLHVSSASGTVGARNGSAVASTSTGRGILKGSLSSGDVTAGSGSASGSAGADLLNNVRQSNDYKAALELELWKETQERLFEEKLRQQEQERLERLNEEWKRKEAEFQMSTIHKQQQYEQMEAQLENALEQLNKNERRVVQKEEQLDRLRRELEQEHQLKLAEVREAARRVQEECDHRLALEQSQTIELQQALDKTKRQLAALEDRYNKLDSDYADFRFSSQSTSQVKLQTEISMLSLEKQELQRKVDSLTKSKLYYKQQWERTMRDMEQMKKQHDAAARQKLQQYDQEMELMRQRQAADDQRHFQTDSRFRLNALQEELANIRLSVPQYQSNSVVKSAVAVSSRSRPSPSKSSPRKDAATDNNDGGAATAAGRSQRPPNGYDHEQASRLIEERDTLLRTGAYTSEHPSIKQLNRKIQEALRVAD